MESALQRLAADIATTIKGLGADLDHRSLLN
jgi:hypothetical protein